MPDNDERPKKKPIESKLVREDPSFADIVIEFVNGLEKRLHEMEEALAAHDLETLRRAAHQLKGSGGGHGYPVLTDRAAALERHAKEKALAECAKALHDLRQLCQRVVVRDE